MYDFGLIGNCQISALVDKNASIRWLCLPRLDSTPIFGSLLDSNGGHFSTAPTDFINSSQKYLANTNILVTDFDCGDDGAISVTDFCPRFEQHGRMYRPAAIFRVIKPERGFPKIRTSCMPVLGWEKTPMTPGRANSHLRYEYPDGLLRVVTNIPLTLLLSNEPFHLQEPAYIALLWDSPLEADLKHVTLDFLERTERYWRTWVKHCAIPPLFQDEVIRSALALKLHCYEDTGAIIAATTTSLPETIGGERNWDYRFCWLRDAFFTLNAFFHLNHFEEMEGYLRFILNIVNYQDDLAPLYGLDQRIPIPEVEHLNWSGYKNSGPVRSNNAAANQIQNDIYGELLLTLAPIYLDQRFQHLRSKQLDKTIFWLTDRCCNLVGKSDAGIWEIRGGSQEHSFTNAMCWAGINRTLKMFAFGKLQAPTIQYENDLKVAEQMAIGRIEAATKDGVVRNSPTDDTLDASLLMLPIIHFPDVDLSRRTVSAIANELRAAPPGEFGENLVFRYRRSDDFGNPENPFMICSFWLAQAYACLGNRGKGAAILSSISICANSLGLYAEHYSVKDRQQLGNFPQTYSHVGVVNAAFAVSPSWMEIL